MIIVDGKKIANNMLAEIAGEVRELKQPLNLASVLIGDINNARKFLEIKQKAAKKVGIGFKLYEFPETIEKLIPLEPPYDLSLGKEEIQLRSEESTSSAPLTVVTTASLTSCANLERTIYITSFLL